MTEIVYAKRIVDFKNIKHPERIIEKRDLTVGIYEERFAEVSEEGGYIVLDFGKEMCGGARILTGWISNKDKFAEIRIRFGESLSEVYSELGEKNSTNDHAPRDFRYLICGLSDLKVGDTGYRFIRIDFPEGVKIPIKTIAGTNTILKMPVRYKYNGADKRIKEIFDAAKRTVDLCSGSGWVWDGIKRDRLVWIGDLYPEILSLTAMYGRVKAIENSLDFERRRARYKGKWSCSIASYSLWWVCCLSEYCYLTNAYAFTKKQIAYVDEIIDIALEHVDEMGEMSYPNYFVDWPTCGTEDDKVGVRFINILAAKKAKRLYEAFGMDTAKADMLLERLLKGDMTVKRMKQVVGLKYYALGEITDEDYALITEGGAKGLSTFMSYFILGAIASRDPDLAISIMKDYYGAMLDKGATTFFEDFDMDWVEGSSRIDELPKDGEKDIHGDFGKHCYVGFRHSLCHAWSSGVIKFIKEYCS